MNFQQVEIPNCYRTGFQEVNMGHGNKFERISSNLNFE